MDLDKYGRVIGWGKVRFQRLIPGPVEKVWAYITESEKRIRWLAKAEMELFEGGAVRLQFLHKELSPFGGSPPQKYKGMEFGHSFIGRVLKISAPNLLVFTWEGDSEVTIELEQVGEKVLLIY